MRQAIGQVTLVVRDYDEAITYYTSVLGFELIAKELGIDYPK